MAYRFFIFVQSSQRLEANSSPAVDEKRFFDMDFLNKTHLNFVKKQFSSVN